MTGSNDIFIDYKDLIRLMEKLANGNELDIIKGIQNLVSRFNHNRNYHYSLRLKIQRRRLALW